MDFKDLLDYAQSSAIASKLEPTEESIYRFICRSYSKTFHTPLHIVMQLDPELVVCSYFENNLDQADQDESLENWLDIIYSIEDPEYESEKENELKDFMETIEEEEQERIKLGKSVESFNKKKTSKKTVLKKEEPPKESQPKGGSLNLEWLEKYDQEG